jgi:hypothetical protein
MSKSMKAFFLAGVLSLAAASAAQAGGNAGDSGGDHANAAPACGDQCPVLAGDGPPTGPGDGTSHSMASATDRSGQVPPVWRPLLASEEGLGSAGDQSGRGTAGGRGGIGGEV